MPHTILTHGHIRTPTTGDVNGLWRNLRGRDMRSHVIMSLGVSLTHPAVFCAMFMPQLMRALQPSTAENQQWN